VASAAFTVMSLALLLLAAGLSFWIWAQRRQSRQAVGQHLDKRLAAEASENTEVFFYPGGRASSEGTGALTGGATEGTQLSRWGTRLTRWLLPAWQLGVLSPRTLLVLVTVIVVLAALAGLAAGMVAAVGLAAMLVLGSFFYIWYRAQHRRRQLVHQLPGFLDSMVRLINIGNSTHAAFQISVPAVKEPLRRYLDDVSALVRAGVELEPALLQVARGMKIDELHLLASILGLSVRYGGRADILLERMANFMRDREQADAELIAMSAETRLSAWVLGLLPVLVGAGIIVINASYFIRMWDDPTGRSMLYGALGLQLLGAFLLYRLARLS
jgi:tight adherence protein B